MHIVIIITVGNRHEADRIARLLVEEKLAACASVIGGVCSVFSWKGKIEQAEECLIMAKTIDGLFEKVKERVKQLHSYENPEILAFNIDKGKKEYLDWISKSVE